MMLDSYLCKKIWNREQWSFISPGSEKSGTLSVRTVPQGIWDKIAERMLLEFAESGCPIFRATTPLSRGHLKSKGRGETVDTLCSRPGND